jgi:hypothetical protein
LSTALLDKNGAADDRWQKIFLKEIVMANGKKYYRDFREHLKALEERGKPIRISALGLKRMKKKRSLP